MARAKFDGVIEAVRYDPEGKIALARLYKRRGAAFSDHVLMDRDDLLRCLKSRRKLVAGKRVEFMAGTFTTSLYVSIQGTSGNEVIVTQGASSSHDWLQDVPLF